VTNVIPIPGEEPETPVVTATKRLPRVQNYTLIKKIGEGGNAVVYAAEAANGAHVAVKMLKESRMASPDARRRFEREYEVTRLLRFPQVVRMIEKVTDGKSMAIVMEYIDGVTLRAVLKRGKLPRDIACALIYEIAKAMSFVHRENVLHRDIKPDNIMITRDGRVKLTDFGIAHDNRTRGTLSMTRTGVLVGTPFYMSPEQLRGTKGKKLDASCDVYSLGMVLYECLAGRLPFDLNKQDPLYKVVNIKTAENVSIRPLNDPELEPVLQRALQRDIKDRTPDMIELMKDLRRFCARDETLRAALSNLVAVEDDGEQPASRKLPKGRVRSKSIVKKEKSFLHRQFLRILALLLLATLLSVGIAWIWEGSFLDGLDTIGQIAAALFHRLASLWTDVDAP